MDSVGEARDSAFDGASDTAFALPSLSALRLDLRGASAWAAVGSAPLSRSDPRAGAEVRKPAMTTAEPSICAAAARCWRWKNGDMASTPGETPWVLLGVSARVGPT